MSWWPSATLMPEVFPRFYERAELPPGSIKQYTDYHEMFEKERLDVVSVATPDHLHANPVCDASNAGIRGVICEKPLTTTIKDADRIIETIEGQRHEDVGRPHPQPGYPLIRV